MKPKLRWEWYNGHRRWTLYLNALPHPTLVFPPKESLYDIGTWLKLDVRSAYPRAPVHLLDK